MRIASIKTILNRNCTTARCLAVISVFVFSVILTKNLTIIFTIEQRNDLQKMADRVSGKAPFPPDIGAHDNDFLKSTPWWACPHGADSRRFQPEGGPKRHHPPVPCPSGDAHIPRPHIPKLLHQTYQSAHIPAMAANYVISWHQYHPNYTYYFWSDNDSRQFIKDKFIDYLDLYDSYKYALERADVARYFILYYFGGIYADLDMEALRPIDPLVNNVSCLLVPEPTEQSLLLYQTQEIVSNAVMAAVPRHRFFARVIDELRSPKRWRTANRKTPADPNTIIHTTGPNMMQNVWIEYQRDRKCCGAFPEYAVSLVSSADLLPTTDVSQVGQFLIRCAQAKLPTRRVRYIQHLQRQACRTLAKHDYVLPVSDKAYTQHHWHHIGYLNDTQKAQLEVVDIHSILPHINIRRYLPSSDIIML